ncbi:MAG: hypothetical protein U0791_03075 [Gemmataceae bacterium]
MSPEMFQAGSLTALIFGGLIALLNFHLSFVRPGLFRLRGHSCRNISGIPLIGSLLLVPAAVGFAVEWHPWLFAATLLLFLLDTGGVVWLVPVLFVELRRNSERAG